MVRRRLTLKRIDPWSVLKFGFVSNLTLLAIGMLGGMVIWFFVRRLELIEKVCGMAFEVGFSNCSVDGGNLFRALLLLGILGVVVQTGLIVFFAFLANLISDLTGGLKFTFTDDTPGASGRGDVRTAGGRAAFEETRATTGRGSSPAATPTEREPSRDAAPVGAGSAARPATRKAPVEKDRAQEEPMFADRPRDTES